MEPLENPSPILLAKDKSKVRRGRVLDIGNGERGKNGKRIPIDLNIGDIVIYKRYGVKEYYLDEMIYLVDEQNILGVIEKSYNQNELTAQQNSFFCKEANNGSRQPEE